MLEEYVILFQLCAIQNYLYEYLKYKFTKNTFLKHEGIIQNKMFDIGDEVYSFLDTPKRTMYTFRIWGNLEIPFGKKKFCQKYFFDKNGLTNIFSLDRHFLVKTSFLTDNILLSLHFFGKNFWGLNFLTKKPLWDQIFYGTKENSGRRIS